MLALVDVHFGQVLLAYYMRIDRTLVSYLGANTIPICK